MKLQSDLRAFIELLNARDVRYVVVGGYAVAHYGHPRYTGDIDVFVEASNTNGDRIQRVLGEFGFAGTELTAADFVQEDIVIQLGLPPNRIDLITSIDAVDFAEAWESRIEATLDGVSVFFISKALLLKNKAATGRAQDIADLEALADKP